MSAHQTNTGRRPLQMTNYSTNLSLRNTGSTCQHQTSSSYSMFLYSQGISLSSGITSLRPGPSAYMKVCDLTPLPWAHEGTGVREIKVRGVFFRSVGGNAEKPLCCRLQITSIWHEGGWRAEAAPCDDPTGNELTATWQWLLDTLFFAPLRGEKLDLCGDHRGLMPAVLSGRCSTLPLLCPCLIIDSIKMAVKLDVSISSGACCLF